MKRPVRLGLSADAPAVRCDCGERLAVTPQPGETMRALFVRAGWSYDVQRPACPRCSERDGSAFFGTCGGQ